MVSSPSLPPPPHCGSSVLIVRRSRPHDVAVQGCLFSVALVYLGAGVHVLCARPSPPLQNECWSCLLGVGKRGCWCCWSVLCGPLSSALNGAPLLALSSVRSCAAALWPSWTWLRCGAPFIGSTPGALGRCVSWREVWSLWLVFIPRAYFCLSSVRRHNKLPLSVTVLWPIINHLYKSSVVGYLDQFISFFDFWVCMFPFFEWMLTNLFVFSCVVFFSSVLDYFALIVLFKYFPLIVSFD